MFSSCGCDWRSSCEPAPPRRPLRFACGVRTRPGWLDSSPNALRGNWQDLREDLADRLRPVLAVSNYNWPFRGSSRDVGRHRAIVAYCRDRSGCGLTVPIRTTPVCHESCVDRAIYLVLLGSWCGGNITSHMRPSRLGNRRVLLCGIF